jgi:hypothetical protein
MRQRNCNALALVLLVNYGLDRALAVSGPCTCPPSAAYIRSASQLLLGHFCPPSASYVSLTASLGLEGILVLKLRISNPLNHHTW